MDIKNVLRESFVNAELIACEFERDFADEPGDLTEIHDTVRSYVTALRDMMAHYEFEEYDGIDELIDDICDLTNDVLNDAETYKNTEYYTYIHSIQDIIIDMFDEFKDEYAYGIIHNFLKSIFGL